MSDNPNLFGRIRLGSDRSNAGVSIKSRSTVGPRYRANGR